MPPQSARAIMPPQPPPKPQWSRRAAVLCLPTPVQLQTARANLIPQLMPSQPDIPSPMPKKTIPSTPENVFDSNDEDIYDNVLDMADDAQSISLDTAQSISKQQIQQPFDDEDDVLYQTVAGSSADLQELQRKALSIPLSSLSGMKKIGEGKFGEVYWAQMDVKTTVAIKIVKRYSSQKVMDEFEKEMSIMSQVCHNNIVRLYGIITEGPFSPAMVMEFLPYGNLKSFLKERERQPNEFLLKCMYDVAMGMHYLCQSGLIHRDLAARNVLVDEKRTCKVSDFGLLREIPKDDSVYISLSGGQSPLRWMPPESIAEKIFSEASDVWSFGVLQWEMFNPNKNPYHGFDTTQMIIKVASGYRMPSPRSSPELASKIMRACWEHDPKKRPTFLNISTLLSARDRLAI